MQDLQRKPKLLGAIIPALVNNSPQSGHGDMSYPFFFLGRSQIQLHSFCAVRGVQVQAVVISSAACSPWVAYLHRVSAGETLAVWRCDCSFVITALFKALFTFLRAHTKAELNDLVFGATPGLPFFSPLKLAQTLFFIQPRHSSFHTWVRPLLLQEAFPDHSVPKYSPRLISALPISIPEGCSYVPLPPSCPSSLLAFFRCFWPTNAIGWCV